MSSGARIGLILAAVVALVLAFVLFSGDDEGSDSAGTPTATVAATTPASPAGETPQTTSTAAAPAATFTVIRVQGGKPVGGVETITVTKGERARIEVSSPDTSDEVHLHGYDLKRDLQAGGSVRFSFAADAEGIFEIELEDAGVQIGALTVEP